MPNTVTPNEAGDARRANSLRANDLWLEVFLIFNFLCLTGDVALAHSENHFRARVEYLPLWFSLAAAVVLSASLFARLRCNWHSAWRDIGHFVGWASIAIGTAGVVYHLDSRFFYERTLKSPAKYEKIREAIESEKRVKAFLYLVPNYQLLHGITDALWRMKQLVLFGLVDDFKRERLNTGVRDSHYKESSLQDALARLLPAKTGT